MGTPDSRIFWPTPRPRVDIEPVFLPFRGCPVKCVFCAQQAQTGQREGQNLAQVLAAVRQRLVVRAERAEKVERSGQLGGAGCGGRRAEKGPKRKPPELAFYGGTFTALPEDELARCLAFAQEMQGAGLVGRLRCSTRPDCVSEALLEQLVGAGFSAVELGVQSFDSAALQQARRGYDGATAARACVAVRQAGLRLGVQLLPGMPGSTPAVFVRDVGQALAQGADLLRFYPCLVLAGTGLAGMWERGEFVPWELETALEALTEGWLLAHQANVPVIRMGLAPEAGLEKAILAGPVHPALGDIVLGRALVQLVRDAMRAAGVDRLERLDVPAHCQGFFWGHRGTLAATWKEMGLHKGNVSFV